MFNNLRVQTIINFDKYTYLAKEFQNKPFNILDVGAGNHSARIFKYKFPNCHYFGIDISKSYNNDADDFALMDDFFEMDLTELKFDNIKDNYFDVILMSHIIEHLYNGDKVIEQLLLKLKPGGLIYIEYPGIKSTKLPTMQGTLNFFDDNTHIRIYSLREIYNLLLKNGVRPFKGGTCRNWLRIILLPLIIPLRLIINKRLLGPDFWDILGFSEYIIAKKKLDS